MPTSVLPMYRLNAPHALPPPQAPPPAAVLPPRQIQRGPMLALPLSTARQDLSSHHEFVPAQRQMAQTQLVRSPERRDIARSANDKHRLLGNPSASASVANRSPTPDNDRLPPNASAEQHLAHLKRTSGHSMSSRPRPLLTEIGSPSAPQLGVDGGFFSRLDHALSGDNSRATPLRRPAPLVPSQGPSLYKPGERSLSSRFTSIARTETMEPDPSSAWYPAGGSGSQLTPGAGPSSLVRKTNRQQDSSGAPLPRYDFSTSPPTQRSSNPVFQPPPPPTRANELSRRQGFTHIAPRYTDPEGPAPPATFAQTHRFEAAPRATPVPEIPARPAKTKPQVNVPERAAVHSKYAKRPVAGNAQEVRAHYAAVEVQRTVFQGVFDVFLDYLGHHCAACWARGFTDEHQLAKCEAGVAMDDDPTWGPWHGNAFCFPENYCWFCLMPEPKIGGWHTFCHPRNTCRHKNRAKPAIFALLTAEPADGLSILNCPHIPRGLFARDDGFAAFRTNSVAHLRARPAFMPVRAP
ncbi:hypothetical protein C8F04DRAFT_1281241 [Mycena alexandri]|uniref:Uncharacterized protein n=1 Tax=Mycena alexandri TaxID=1745969 RepID=A0AAD6WMA3_9AGAR|nr:hypothetical protein C8F04DRAFT_1281241 [Mycena alexandri]